MARGIRQLPEAGPAGGGSRHGGAIRKDSKKARPSATLASTFREADEAVSAVGDAIQTRRKSKDKPSPTLDATEQKAAQQERARGRTVTSRMDSEGVVRYSSTPKKSNRSRRGSTGK